MPSAIRPTRSGPSRPGRRGALATGGTLLLCGGAALAPATAGAAPADLVLAASPAPPPVLAALPIATIDPSPRAVPVRATSVRATPLRAMPLRAMPLRAMPLRATSLRAVPPRAATPRAVPSLAESGLPSAEAWAAAARDARSLARRAGARTRFAIRIDGRTWSFRGHETTHANSLVKATVLVAYLRRGNVRGRALTSRERGMLSPMIRRSANGPVNTLIGMMGGLQPLRDVGRLVGMRDFRPVAGSWGASRISAKDEARLFSRLYSVLPPRHRVYALRLLRTITLSQRWGMPKAAPRGWRVSFKSGWNGRGRVLQAMRLTCKGHVVSASVLVDGGAHGSSVHLVERTGRRLLQPLRVRGREACSSVVRTPAG